MHISFDHAILTPLIRQVVGEVLEELDRERTTLADRLAYGEAEAAVLLGIRRHVLRDARLRGELAGCRVGKRVLYQRDELLGYLRKQREL